jgi:SAM-dependent methyltransferase
VRVDESSALDRALCLAREAAFPRGEFVGQESFVSASEILSLAGRAGVAPGVHVLDLCCGVGGPGLFITRELGCAYLGVDASAHAVARARQRAAELELDARFEVARVPPLPRGRFEVVLLLETMLAFRDKRNLLREISSVLPMGGRFAFTVEEGQPLTEAERDVMPGSDTVWLTTLPDLLTDLELAGLQVRWRGESGTAHRATVDALVGAYSAAELGGGPGRDTLDNLVTSHRLWSQWLQEGRVRKFAMIAERASA